MNCANCDADLVGGAVNISISGVSRCYCCRECATYDTRPRLYTELKRMLGLYTEDKKNDGEHLATLVKMVGSMGHLTETQFLKQSAEMYALHGDAEVAAEIQKMAEACAQKNSFKDMRSKIAFLKLHLRITCLLICVVQLVMGRAKSAFHRFKTRVEEAYVDLLELCPNDDLTCVTAANMKNWTYFVDEVAVYFVGR